MRPPRQKLMPTPLQPRPRLTPQLPRLLLRLKLLPRGGRLANKTLCGKLTATWITPRSCGTGLISQLEYEKYSTEDANWATDRVAVDWNEQAAKKARSYLEYTSFSRSGLVDQLLYEGFTPEQAEFGVSTTGL